MPTFLSDGIEFHYRDSGDGVGKLPFVFQHGLGGDCGQTFGLFQPPPGIRMLTLDCRAHGETRPVGSEEKISISQSVEDVRRWLDALGIEKMALGGISMGAALALEFALRFPERIAGLVLCRPAWLDSPRIDGFELFSIAARLMRAEGPERENRCRR